MPKRSKVILFGALIATILLILEIVIYSDAASNVNSPNSAEAVGTAIGIMLVLPHVIFFALGCLFNWIGYGTKVRGFVLTAGILYCVALVLGIQNFYMVLLPIILAFVGFAKQGTLNKKAADSKA